MALFIAILLSFFALDETRGVAADPIGSTITYQIQWVLAGYATRPQDNIRLTRHPAALGTIYVSGTSSCSRA